MSNSRTGPVILGVYLGHDPSCCLMRGGQVQCAIEEERLNRYKHGRPRSLGGLWSRFHGRFGYFPWASLTYCLRSRHMSLDDVDLIVIGDDQWAKDAKDTLQDLIPIADKSKILYVDHPKDCAHHFHHGLGAFFLSSCEQAAVLVIDGDGNMNADGYEAETGFLMKRTGEWTQVFKNRYAERVAPRSGLGWMYEQVSYVLGYGDRERGLADPGKTMGLSSYGNTMAELSSPWVTFDDFKLEFSGFKQWLRETGYDRFIFNPENGLARASRQPLPLAQNIAYKLQYETEQALLHLAKTLQKATESTDLCLAGGVALNSVANGRLLREKIFENIHIIPTVHDGGQSLGLAIHGHLLVTHPRFVSGMRHRTRDIKAFEEAPIAPLTTAYLGSTYSHLEIERMVSSLGIPYARLDSEELIHSATTRLIDGGLIGWFQGGAEIGPRALGNRSILASPSIPGIKDRLNAKVKFREGFRPFAPAVLAECASEIFDLSGASPYMLLVAGVLPHWRERISAVVHVDGTARVQTVSEADNYLLHKLLRSMHDATDIPVLLNTSFNLAGMPIVESPRDALDCFFQTQLDELYLGNYRVIAAELDAVTYGLKEDWSLMTDAMISDGIVTVRSPTGARFVLTESANIAEALVLSLHRGSPRAAAEEIRLHSDEYNRLEGLLKRLLRMGCVEMAIGSYRLCNTQNDLSWDKMLYDSV